MGEDLYELPKGWVWVTLDSISLKITDGEHIRPKVTNDGIFFLSAKDVRDNGVVFDNTLFISEDDAKKFRQRCDPEAGDILVVSRGATVGRSCIVNIKKIFCLLGSVILIKIFKQISNNFISYLLKSLTIQEELISISGATAQQAIYLRDIKKVVIPLPPLPEQHCIVAKIEELFTQLDAGVELLKKVKAKLKRYRQAVLKAAVEGNLTKEWREANQGELEPGSVLLERILKQRREKWEAEQLAKMKAQGKIPKDDSWKLKYKEPVAPDTSDLPELPHGWCWVNYDQIGEWFGGGTPRTTVSEYWEGGTIPWVSSKDMKSFKISRSEDTITQLGLANSTANLILVKHLLHTCEFETQALNLGIKLQGL
ncbi:restriction endonuclease subunit S [Tolypothrix sp. VBCCA 56010]|uniref:restriction endonuclease subunit S n=1 Tax=Tolypothrix sp. VBCCA 56010 TaxID=3137731 RepID=UPI003D7DD394